jgi:hypothetical protein
MTVPTDAQIEELIKVRNQRYGKAFTDLSVDDVLSFHSQATVFNDVGECPFLVWSRHHPDVAREERPTPHG